MTYEDLCKRSNITIGDLELTNSDTALRKTMRFTFRFNDCRTLYFTAALRYARVGDLEAVEYETDMIMQAIKDCIDNESAIERHRWNYQHHDYGNGRDEGYKDVQFQCIELHLRSDVKYLIARSFLKDVPQQDTVFTRVYKPGQSELDDIAEELREIRVKQCRARIIASCERQIKDGGGNARLVDTFTPNELLAVLKN